MTEPIRHSPDDPRPEPDAAGSGDPPFDQWEELFAELHERAAPDPARGRLDDLALARRVAAWSVVDDDVAAVGYDLGVDLTLAASSRRPSPLLSAVGRLVDADPADPAGRSVYLAAFRRPVIRLALYLGRRSGADAASWYEAVQEDVLRATHEIVVFGTLYSGTAVVERARALGLRRLHPAAGSARLATRGLLARWWEALEAAVHDLLGPDLLDRVLQRLVPLDALARLEATVEDGVELDTACRRLRLSRRVARRQLAGYRSVRPLYEADASRLRREIAALEERERVVIPDGNATVGVEQLAGRLVVSVPEAAALLGISRALAYELVARGELPSLRLGRRVVVPTRPLLEFVAGVTAPADGAVAAASRSRLDRAG